MKLSPLDRLVADYIALGLGNREIAQKVKVSEATVKWHVVKLLLLTEARNRVQLAMFWPCELFHIGLRELGRE